MVIALLFVFLVAAGMFALFRWYAPFGGKVAGGRKLTAETSGHYAGGKFTNLIATPMEMDAKAFRSMLRDQLRGNPLRRPAVALQPDMLDLESALAGGGTRLVWLGHSSFIVRASDKTILLDPVFSRRASPFQFAGPKRFDGPLPIAAQDMPAIDAVVISHDHYDHLDYGSIKKLRSKIGHFYVPLGVGAHLERWGVAPSAITELNWWETATLGDITLACTPSRHFSGRQLNDRFATLWASWVITVGGERLFFSGDTGYGPHFAEIGKKYGPFDVTLMECGQYDERWRHIHMMPEQTVTAAQDLRSKLLLPIHWGAFSLAFHDWTDSVERVTKAAKKAGLHVATPRLGQILHLKNAHVSTEAWWRKP